jgi:hypothetical protein
MKDNILFDGKKGITRFIRLLVKEIELFLPKLNDRLFNNSNSRNIIYSYKQNVYYCIPSQSREFFLNGADYKRYGANNLYHTIKSCIDIKQKNIGSIIEVGSSWGEEVLYLSNLTNVDKVYCFEPNEISFSCLKQNIEELELENVSATNSFVSSVPSSGAVPTVCLDDYFSEGLNDLLLIKIDTDGDEIEVLKGASNLIEKFKPLVIIEFLPTWEYSGLRGVEVLELYRQMGFSIRHPKFCNVELTNEQIIDFFNDTAFTFTHDILLHKT